MNEHPHKRAQKRNPRGTQAMKWRDLGAVGKEVCPLGLKQPAHQEVCKCTGIHFQALKCLGTHLNDSIQFSGNFAANGLRK